MNKKISPDSCYDSDCNYVYCDHCNHSDMEAYTDIGTVSSTTPNSRTSQIINTPLSALLYSFTTNMKQF